MKVKLIHKQRQFLTIIFLTILINYNNLNTTKSNINNKATS